MEIDSLGVRFFFLKNASDLFRKKNLHHKRASNQIMELWKAKSEKNQDQPHYFRRE